MSRETNNIPRIPIREKILFIAMIILIGVVLLELLLRGWFFISGKPQSPAAMRQEIRIINSVVTERIPNPETAKQFASPEENHPEDIAHPFYGVETAPSLNYTGKLIKYFQSGNQEEEYVIMVVGGSVAGLFCYDQSWNEFTNALHKDPNFRNRNIRLVNYARGGFKQPQQAGMVSYLISAGFKPDAVINIDGFNEVALGNYNAANNVFPLYPSLAHWGHLSRSGVLDAGTVELLHRIVFWQKTVNRIGNTALQFGFPYSIFLSRTAILAMNAARTSYIDSCKQYVSWLTQGPRQGETAALKGPPFNKDFSAVMDSIVNCWSESSLSIDSICRARSIHYLHILQPTLHDDGSKPVTDEERSRGVALESWTKGAREGYPRLREAGLQLTARGVHFFDCSMVFKEVKETIYYDPCHFGGIGLEIFGRAVAQAYLDSLPASGAR